MERSESMIDKFELDAARSPWVLRLKDSITISKHCRGGNEALPEVECHSFAVIPRLEIALKADETALAIHSLYAGGPVPDLSGVRPNTLRLQDWFLFAAIAQYPRFRQAVAEAWETDKRNSRSTEAQPASAENERTGGG